MSKLYYVNTKKQNIISIIIVIIKIGYNARIVNKLNVVTILLKSEKKDNNNEKKM